MSQAIIECKSDFEMGPGQGPLTLPVFSFSVWPMVVKVVSMARMIEIFCITRYQMKDMDIIFPLVSHDQILLEWLGHSEIGWFLVVFKIPFCSRNFQSNHFFSKITPFKDEAT